MSKVVIGHKVLNLEELYNVSCLGSAHQVEVVVDSQLYAELSKAPAKADAAGKKFEALTEAGQDAKFTPSQIRAILLVKLVQMLKLKKNATSPSVDFLLRLLNEPSVSLAFCLTISSDRDPGVL